MMNKKYLKDNGLYEAHKQFMRLCEAAYPNHMIEEDDPQQDPNGLGTDPNAMGGAPDAMGGGMQQAPNSMGGGDPSMGGGADPSAMGGDPNMGADPSMGGGDPNAVDGGMPQGPNATDGGEDPNAMGGAPDAMGGDPNMGDTDMGSEQTEEPEEKDTIDIDGLTKAQEKINNKTNKIGKEVIDTNDSINKLFASLKQMEDMINSNNKKIEDLNKEFQMRVKTPTEKLNLRSLDSYPFNVKPTSYWDKALKDMPQYSITSDNDMSPKDELAITQSDIDSKNDKEIEDSFIDDEMKQSINKIFGL